MIYIAAPFFNPEQLAFVKKIEDILDKSGMDYFSPRSSGMLKDATPEEREAHMNNIYDVNMAAMRACTSMIAVIDDYDTGTVFEIGYFTRLKELQPSRYILTISNNNHGINIMLKNSIDAHILDADEIIDCLTNETLNDVHFKDVI